MVDASTVLRCSRPAVAKSSHIAAGVSGYTRLSALLEAWMKIAKRGELVVLANGAWGTHCYLFQAADIN